MPSNWKLNLVGLWYVKMGVRSFRCTNSVRQDREAKVVQKVWAEEITHRRRPTGCVTAGCKGTWIGHRQGGEGMGPGRGERKCWRRLTKHLACMPKPSTIRHQMVEINVCLSQLYRMVYMKEVCILLSPAHSYTDYKSAIINGDESYEGSEHSPTK